MIEKEYGITGEDVMFLATDFLEELDSDNQFDALCIESINCIERGLQLIFKIDSDLNALDDLGMAIVNAMMVVLLMHEIRFYSFVREPVRCWLPPLTDESGSMSQEKSPDFNKLFGEILLNSAKNTLNRYDFQLDQ